MINKMSVDLAVKYRELMIAIMMSNVRRITNSSSEFNIDVRVSHDEASKIYLGHNLKMVHKLLPSEIYKIKETYSSVDTLTNGKYGDGVIIQMPVVLEDGRTMKSDVISMVMDTIGHNRDIDALDPVHIDTLKGTEKWDDDMRYNAVDNVLKPCTVEGILDILKMDMNPSTHAHIYGTYNRYMADGNIDVGDFNENYTTDETLKYLSISGHQLYRPFKGKVIMVIGRSDLVGKPLVKILRYLGCTVLEANSSTPQHTKTTMMCISDYVICATGSTNHELPSNFMDIVRHSDQGKLKIIDVGIIKENGKLRGDIYDRNVVSIKECGIYCTPVPGGVGQLTTRNFVSNIVKLSIRKFYFEMESPCTKFPTVDITELLGKMGRVYSDREVVIPYSDTKSEIEKSFFDGIQSSIGNINDEMKNLNVKYELLRTCASARDLMKDSEIFEAYEKNGGTLIKDARYERTPSEIWDYMKGKDVHTIDVCGEGSLYITIPKAVTGNSVYIDTPEILKEPVSYNRYSKGYKSPDDTLPWNEKPETLSFYGGYGFKKYIKK